MGISEQATLLCEQKNVNQSLDFPVRRTGSYRHKKSTVLKWWGFGLALSRISLWGLFLNMLFGLDLGIVAEWLIAVWRHNKMFTFSSAVLMHISHRLS